MSQSILETSLREKSEWRKLQDFARTNLGKSPLRAKQNQYAYLDREDIRRERKQDNGTYKLDFYVEGIHCSRCMWLIEETAMQLRGVNSIRVNMGKSVAMVEISEDGSFAAVAEALAELGYPARPVSQERERESIEAKENRSYLYRIGVAAFCAGNIMILAVSVYGGLDGVLANYFGWLSLLLAFPCLTYSAFPFYQNAWAALKQRSISIDLPITIALFVGALDSVRKVWIGNPDLFLDSLTVLVFLLLLSRYALRRIRQSVFSSSHFMKFFQPQMVRKLKEDSTEDYIEIDTAFVESGDKLLIKKGEWFPVDGVLLSDSALVDQSAFNGESVPVKLNKGDKIFAGCRLLSASASVECSEIGEETRIAKLLSKVEENLVRKSSIVTFSDKVARYFVVAVLAVSGALCAYGLWIGTGNYFDRALALVILTCPCALALGTPLAFTIALGRSARQGLLIKDGSVLEKLLSIRNLIFDKTGTLTEGKFEVRHFELLDQTVELGSLNGVISQLESGQVHPIAQALLDFSASPEFPAKSDKAKLEIEVLKTGGVAAKIDGAYWEIRPRRESDLVPSVNDSDSAIGLLTEILILRDGNPIARFVCGDSLRKDVLSMIREARSLGMNIHLLSGDQAEPCKYLAKQFELDPKQIHSQVSPEAKEVFVASTRDAAMIGDGINDSAAIAKANVGIAIKGGLDASLHAADIYLANGVTELPKLFQAAKMTRNTIVRNLSISLAYNSIGGIAAILGFINPLLAAVLMPLSSLTVVLSSYFGGQK